MNIRNTLFSFVLGLCMALGMVWLLGGLTTQVAAAPAAITRYVDDTTGSDDSDCSTPGDPCQTIQYAVDQAGADDEIRVAAGTYADTIARAVPASGLITQVVYVSETVTIRGGYTSADWMTSDPAANLTTLDAEGGKRVVFVSEGITVTLENLHITGGDAAGLGGAMFFRDVGGGVYVMSATTTLDGNVIYGNTANGAGGVLFYFAGGALSGNAIYDNKATDICGGVALAGGNGVILSNNDIHHNTAVTSSGGVHVELCTDVTMDSNAIYSNGAGADGGGVSLFVTVARLDNNVIADNQAGTDGGGVYV